MIARGLPLALTAAIASALVAIAVAGFRGERQRRGDPRVVSAGGAMDLFAGRRPGNHRLDRDAGVER